MKQKILLAIKKYILSLSAIRKAFNSEKEVLIAFLRADLSVYENTELWADSMDKMHFSTESELKLRALDIYCNLFTADEYRRWYHYIMRSEKNNTTLKKV